MTDEQPNALFPSDFLDHKPPQPLEIDPHYLRMETRTVPVTPAAHEDGAIEYTRALAFAVCDAMAGTTWQALTRYRHTPHSRVDARSDFVVIVDDRRLVRVAHRCPAGTMRDTWAIRLNGRPIPHRHFAREVLHAPEIIARSIWRHTHGITVDGCDTFDCSGAATVASFGSRFMCRRCARRYVQTGR
jgi:rubredoxin